MTTVPPSSEPDSATATGTGAERDAAAPPPKDEAAATTGLGTAEDQSGAGAPAGDAPYDLSPGKGDDGQEPQSPSGT